MAKTLTEKEREILADLLPIIAGMSTMDLANLMGYATAMIQFGGCKAMEE